MYIKYKQAPAVTRFHVGSFLSLLNSERIDALKILSAS